MISSDSIIAISCQCQKIYKPLVIFKVSTVIMIISIQAKIMLFLIIFKVSIMIL